MDFGVDAQAQPPGVGGHRQGRPLPHEEEQDHRDRRLGHLRRRQDDLGRERRRRRPRRSPATTSSSPPARPPGWSPAPSCRENVVTYEEQILDENLPGSIVIAGSGAIGVEFAYVMANFGVDVTIVEFLDRMVPTEDEEISKELAKHYKKLGVKVLLEHQGRDDRRLRRQGQGHRQQGRQGGDPRDRQGPPGHRLRAAPRRLRPRQDRRRDHRPRRDRGRRPRPHQRRRRLRDRRRHRQDDAGPRRRGDGHRGRRDDRRRGDRRDRLRHDPARDVLPAADRVVRLLRGAGQGQGVRRQDREVPVLRQRQGAWASATASAS